MLMMSVFNLVPILVVQDLIKSLEKFWWESFKFWLDAVSAHLTERHDKEADIGVFARGGKVESPPSSSFPFLTP